MDIQVFFYDKKLFLFADMNKNSYICTSNDRTGKTHRDTTP